MKIDKKTLGLLLFVLGVFLLFISPYFLTQGMFLDGLWYSTIAHNLACGYCSPWHLSLTDTYNHTFYSHPPLAFWLQAGFFNIFGDAFWVDKLYSVLTIIISALFIVRIWKLLGFEKNLIWLPLLFFFIIPDISWCATNNMLENTMMIFVLLSVIFMLKAQSNKKRFVYLFLSGISLVLVFLTKGFTGLYPLAFPLVYWLIERRDKFSTVLQDTLFILFVFLVFMQAILFIPQARNYMIRYFALVLSGVDVPVVNTRFLIFYKFFSQLLLPIALVLTCLLVKLRFNFRAFSSRTLQVVGQKNMKIFLMLIIFSLCGVVPMMISLKQRGFYLITVYPFMAIAFAGFVSQIVKNYSQRLTDKKNNIILYSGGSVLLLAIILNVCNYGKIGRDETKIKETNVICSQLEEGDTVSVLRSTILQSPNLCAYFYREKRVNLAFNKLWQKYLLIEDEQMYKRMQLDTLYEPIYLKTAQYKLYKMKSKYRFLKSRDIEEESRSNQFKIKQ